jgi:hypothetical protein
MRFPLANSAEKTDCRSFTIVFMLRKRALSQHIRKRENMSLTSLRFGRYSELIVVSKDMRTAVKATAIAPTMQYALDNWDAVSPVLERMYRALNMGDAQGAFALGLDARRRCSVPPSTWTAPPSSVISSATVPPVANRCRMACCRNRWCTRAFPIIL